MSRECPVKAIYEAAKAEPKAPAPTSAEGQSDTPAADAEGQEKQPKEGSDP